MDLLTASETQSIQRFLSSVNYDGGLIDSVLSSNEWSSLGEEVPVPHAHGREALAKATKDLMSLSASTAALRPPPPLALDAPPFRAAKPPQDAPQMQLQPGQPQHSLVSSFQAWEHALRGRPDFAGPSSAPYPRAQSSSSQSLLGDVSPSSSSSPLALPPPPPTSASRKRSADGPPVSPTTQKRPRASASRPKTDSGGGKPALLTPSQKKANHIQSEQKRRANIRRGYDALCATVPALVEAIAAEDAAAAAAKGKERESGADGKKRRRKGRGRDEDEDKADGRAGPRSENVVLGKTVEYVESLLARRSALLARLQHARAALPPGHPGHAPACAPELPLWEREWSGGQGDDEDEDGGDDE